MYTKDKQTGNVQIAHGTWTRWGVPSEGLGRVESEPSKGELVIVPAKHVPAKPERYTKVASIANEDCIDRYGACSGNQAFGTTGRDNAAPTRSQFSQIGCHLTPPGAVGRLCWFGDHMGGPPKNMTRSTKPGETGDRALEEFCWVTSPIQDSCCPSYISRVLGREWGVCCAVPRQRKSGIRLGRTPVCLVFRPYTPKAVRRGVGGDFSAASYQSVSLHWFQGIFPL